MYGLNFSVDCIAGNYTRSPGPCNANCGAEGIRTVRLTPIAEILAKYKGARCQDELVEEECMGECDITTTTGRQQEFFLVFSSRPCKL